MKKILRNSWFWIICILLETKTRFFQDKMAPTAKAQPVIYAVASPPPKLHIYSVASAPSGMMTFYKLSPFLLGFFAVITTIIGIIWHQKTKLTKKWFQFFTSKTFFITLAACVLVFILYFLWLTRSPAGN